MNGLLLPLKIAMAITHTATIKAISVNAATTLLTMQIMLETKVKPESGKE